MSPLINSINGIGQFLCNIDYIEQNLCENRAEPTVGCKGTCVLAKMLSENSNKTDPFQSDLMLDTIDLTLGFFDRIELLGGVFTPSLDKNIGEQTSLYQLLLVNKFLYPPEL